MDFPDFVRAPSSKIDDHGTHDSFRLRSPETYSHFFVIPGSFELTQVRRLGQPYTFDHTTMSEADDTCDGPGKHETDRNEITPERMPFIDNEEQSDLVKAD
eukprot:4633960-Ditylum_brightwellii.AAC.1